MSGSRPTPAEQHLGDRLAALVDGELNHDSRERVLAHLATCAKCKAEADAQRRLKDVFAQSAPPGPSEGFLARLQGLPGGSGDEDGDGGGGPFGRGRFGDGALGVFAADDRLDGLSFGRRIDYEAPSAHRPMFPAGSGDRGFRIHEVGRPEGERSGGRRPRRFAFAAASAVSMAAIALGGALPLDSTTGPTARGERTGGVSPARAATPASGSDSSRRQGGATSVGSGITSTGGTFGAGGDTTVLSSTTSASGASGREFTTGTNSGTPTAPPAPYGSGLKIFPIALPQGAAPQSGGGHGPWRQGGGVRNFQAYLNGIPTPSLIPPAPTPPPSTASPAPSHLAVPAKPGLAVSPGR
ncbi:anti-sigma factor family protein [Streptomyces sp. NPDC004111]|uniref:anti-sigma factor family protein n=1 Tax=Streptomyces sp. NPDC004111 TaxID=3364690 RepID=UPI00369088C0